MNVDLRVNQVVPRLIDLRPVEPQTPTAFTFALNSRGEEE